MFTQYRGYRQFYTLKSDLVYKKFVSFILLTYINK